MSLLKLLCNIMRRFFRALLRIMFNSKTPDDYYSRHTKRRGW